MPYNAVTTCQHEAMVRILAPHFVAGAILHDYVVVKAAPIIKYMIGWKLPRVQTYCQDKAWELEMIMEFSF